MNSWKNKCSFRKDLNLFSLPAVCLLRKVVLGNRNSRLCGRKVVRYVWRHLQRRNSLAKDQKGNQRKFTLHSRKDFPAFRTVIYFWDFNSETAEKCHLYSKGFWGQTMVFQALCTVHRGAFCQSSFRWIYYYGSNKSTGKETGTSVQWSEIENSNRNLYLIHFLKISFFKRSNSLAKDKNVPKEWKIGFGLTIQFPNGIFSLRSLWSAKLLPK